MEIRGHGGNSRSTIPRFVGPIRQIYTVIALCGSCVRYKNSNLPIYGCLLTFLLHYSLFLFSFQSPILSLIRFFLRLCVMLILLIASSRFCCALSLPLLGVIFLENPLDDLRLLCIRNMPISMLFNGIGMFLTFTGSSSLSVKCNSLGLCLFPMA